MEDGKRRCELFRPPRLQSIVSSMHRTVEYVVLRHDVLRPIAGDASCWSVI